MLLTAGGFDVTNGAFVFTNAPGQSNWSAGANSIVANDTFLTIYALCVGF
jgi:hypothetical protein